MFYSIVTEIIIRETWNIREIIQFLNNKFRDCLYFSLTSGRKHPLSTPTYLKGYLGWGVTLITQKRTMTRSPFPPYNFLTLFLSTYSPSCSIKVGIRNETKTPLLIRLYLYKESPHSHFMSSMKIQSLSSQYFLSTSLYFVMDFFCGPVP